jgi:sialate O-acetylesterase
MGLSPGITLTNISLSYKYTTGYLGPVGANFSLVVGETSVYASPLLTLYPYSKAGDFSPPTPVAAQGLSIKVAPGTDKLAFDFQGGDRNVQLLLPMTITVHCMGGPCIAQSKLLPYFFDSNMVLQRGPAKAAVWGDTAAPGDEVTVSLSSGDDTDAVGGPWKATAASNGSWAVAIDPQTAGSGFTLTVSTKSGRKQVLNNLAFGDVVLCSGQSNMGFSANLEFNASNEIADSVNYPGLRFWTSAQVAGNTPQTDLKNVQLIASPAMVGVYASSAWAVSRPAAFVPAGPTDGAKPACPGCEGFTWPSAICYFYGRDVYKGLGGKVPIGLVTADWGGQPIEPFMSADALADKTCGGTKPAAAAAPPPPPAPAAVTVSDSSSHGVSVGSGNPSTIWNGMIAPLAKMRFAAAVW